MSHHRHRSTRFNLPTLLTAFALCGTLAACDGVVAPDQPAASGAAPTAAVPRSSGLISGGYQADGLISGGYKTNGLISGGYRTNGLITGGYRTNGLITGGYNNSAGDARSQGLISGGY